MASLSEQITALAAPLAASLGLGLWGVEYVPGGRSVLRVYVEDESAPDEIVRGEDDVERDGGESDAAILADLPGGVTIEQCAELSRLLGLALEVEDLIPGAYVLEVSSPGLDRTFFSARQLAGALGMIIEITYADAPEDYPGRRKFRGVLEQADPDAGFALRLEDAALPGEEPALLRFAFADVKKAKQVFVVPVKERPGKGGKKGSNRRTGKEDARVRA